MKITVLLFSLAFAGLAAAAADEKVVKALQGFDPVELSAGKEVAGKEEITVERGRYRYQFATEENRRKFAEGGDRYAIQFGGACMKMGPLSGRGSADRWEVHAGRIYLFASDMCRDSFRKDPAAYVDAADAAPAVKPEAAARGAELMARAVAGMGGADVMKKVETWQVRYQFTSQAGGRERKNWRHLVMSFPGTCVQMDEYPGWRGGWMLKDKDGWLSGDKGVAVEDPVRQFMVREVYRQPVAILKAWQRGEAAVSASEGKDAAERVTVSIHGATTTLTLEPKTGRILEAAWKGRAGMGIHNIVKTYSDFREVKGLVAPFAVSVSVDGKPVSDPVIAVEWVKVNETLAPDLLAVPQ